MTVAPDSRPPATDRPGGRDVPGRRAVLRGLAAVGAAGSLAACGGGADDVATGPGAAGSPTTTGSPTTPAAPSAGSSTGSPTPSSPGGPALAATADVPVGGARIVAERGIVITQPEAGSFKAFSSLCTHQRCPVTEVRGDAILCKCHGSAFSITDGAPRTGPATQPLPEVPIAVSGGQIRRA